MSDEKPEEKTIIAQIVPQAQGQGSRRKTASLVLYNGVKLGRRFPLTESVMVVGRSSDVQIVLNEASVSRRHAQFESRGDRVYIKDLESSNGTFINDKPVKNELIKDGDLIRLGEVVLKFFAHDNADSLVNDRIYQMATMDPGTDVFNKQFLADSLESEFKYAKAYKTDLSIVYYDLDHFKSVNDTYGHNVGDFVLRESAALMKSAIRKGDLICRFGGEEFVVVMGNTDLKTACDFAERIRALHENHAFIFEATVGQEKTKVRHKQTISLGVAQLHSSMSSAKELLEAADKKLYISKKTGRNKITA